MVLGDVKESCHIIFHGSFMPKRGWHGGGHLSVGSVGSTKTSASTVFAYTHANIHCFYGKTHL